MSSPDPISDPQGYQQHLLDLLGDDDPAEVQAATPARLRTLLDEAGDDLRAVPEPGEWSVFGCLAHITDAEVVMSGRYRWVLAQDEPPLLGYDQDLWVDHLHTEAAQEVPGVVAGGLRAAAPGERRLVAAHPGRVTVAGGSARGARTGELRPGLPHDRRPRPVPSGASRTRARGRPLGRRRPAVDIGNGIKFRDRVADLSGIPDPVCQRTPRTPTPRVSQNEDDERRHEDRPAGRVRPAEPRQDGGPARTNSRLGAPAAAPALRATTRAWRRRPPSARAAARTCAPSAPRGTPRPRASGRSSSPGDRWASERRSTNPRSSSRSTNQVTCEASQCIMSAITPMGRGCSGSRIESVFMWPGVRPCSRSSARCSPRWNFSIVNRAIRRQTSQATVRFDRVLTPPS